MKRTAQTMIRLTSVKRFLKGKAPALSSLLSRISKKITVADENFHPFSALPLRADHVGLVVDIGAYQGDYSYKALRLYPNARLISFEPSPENAARFRANILARKEFVDRVMFHQVAVSGSTGMASLNLTSYGPANSLERQAEEHKRQNPHVFEVGACDVRTLRLDDVDIGTDCIDVIKIDVEGHELKVLEGGVNALRRTRFVIVEVSLARDSGHSSQSVFDLFAFMNQQGFSLYSIVDIYAFDTPGEYLGMAQFDAIFRNVKPD